MQTPKPNSLNCTPGLRALAAMAAAALLALPAAHAAPAPVACERLAEVHGVRVGQGPVMVAIYTDEATFMKRPQRALRLAAEAEVLQVPLCELPGDAVALMVFQDLNANGRMDFNPFGIPNEPYAASGRPVLGSPSWASARVALPAQGLTKVELSQ
jgi:uncharacterized protein (DUF2141 family)